MKFVNVAKWDERQVRLHTGELVSNFSEEWRHETEANHVLNVMTSRVQRRVYLRGEIDPSTGRATRKGVLQMRGEVEATRLEQTITSIWQALRAQKAVDTTTQDRLLTGEGTP